MKLLIFQSPSVSCSFISLQHPVLRHPHCNILSFHNVRDDVSCSFKRVGKFTLSSLRLIDTVPASLPLLECKIFHTEGTYSENKRHENTCLIDVLVNFVYSHNVSKVVKY
jgi:hypothetical protein